MFEVEGTILTDTHELKTFITDFYKKVFGREEVADMHYKICEKLNSFLNMTMRHRWNPLKWKS